MVTLALSCVTGHCTVRCLTFCLQLSFVIFGVFMLSSQFARLATSWSTSSAQSIYSLGWRSIRLTTLWRLSAVMWTVLFLLSLFLQTDLFSGQVCFWIGCRTAQDLFSVLTYGMLQKQVARLSRCCSWQLSGVGLQNSELSLGLTCCIRCCYATGAVLCDVPCVTPGGAVCNRVCDVPTLWILFWRTVL